MSAPIILCDTAGMTNERWLECRAHGPKGTRQVTIRSATPPKKKDNVNTEV